MAVVRKKSCVCGVVWHGGVIVSGDELQENLLRSWRAEKCLSCAKSWSVMSWRGTFSWAYRECYVFPLLSQNIYTFGFSTNLCVKMWRRGRRKLLGKVIHFQKVMLYTPIKTNCISISVKITLYIFTACPYH